MAGDKGTHWSEDDRFPVRDWQDEVANGDTRLGYGAWVEQQREWAEAGGVADETEAEPTRCPTAERAPGDITGCGSLNVSEDPTEPGVWDCHDCGIWFTPALEPKQ